MKSIFLICTLFFGINFAQAQTRGTIDKNTRLFTVKAALADKYSVIGYAEPDRKSQKMIIFSVYDNEVTDNPMNLPLGAYHETTGLKDGDHIEYDSEAGQFVKLNYIRSNKTITPFYIERGFIKFSQ